VEEGVSSRERETTTQFESRKGDHIRLSLSDRNEAVGESGLDRVQLLHEALPDLNFSQISLEVRSLGAKLKTPYLISSMTAGHVDSLNLNLTLAKAASARGWRMGVGSQRREIHDPQAVKEWKTIRKQAPHVQLLGNLGLAQLISSSLEDVERLVEGIEAHGMIIHLNALQECMQPEGTPNFKGGLKAIEKLCARLKRVPVIVKETGCGFSRATLKRLRSTGVAAVDVSGLGGTHWGRIEGARAKSQDVRHQAAQSFASWGISTVDSLVDAMEVKADYEVWASGGVRSGVDAAKLLAMGAGTVGFAKPLLEAAVRGDEALDHRMSVLEYELQTALFCLGVATIAELKKKRVWKWQTR